MQFNNLPTVLKRIIMEYAQEKEQFDKVLTELMYDEWFVHSPYQGYSLEDLIWTVDNLKKQEKTLKSMPKTEEVKRFIYTEYTKQINFLSLLINKEIGW